MSNTNHNKKEGRSTISKVAVGAAVIGGIAATVAAAKNVAPLLNSKDAKDKLNKGVKEVKEQADGLFSELSDRLDALRDKIEAALSETETAKAASKLKDSLGELRSKLADLPNATADDAKKLSADVRERIEKLQQDYEAMIKRK